MNRFFEANPLISVLVACHNAAPYLAETLRSALSQTYPKIEVIVVDDGSTDGSLEIARGFDDRRIHILTQANSGQPAALNTALASSRGAYVQYLDADDLLHPQKIELQIERLAREEPGIMASGAWGRFENDASKTVFVAEEVWQDLAPVDWLVKSWQGGGMMHVAGWLIPREVVDAAGPWPETLRWAANIDGDFFTRALLASKRCLFCVDALSYYRRVYGSHSGLRSAVSLAASFAVIQRTGEALLTVEDSIRTRAAYADNLQRFIYSTYPDGPDLVAVAEARVKALGGSRLEFDAGPMTGALTRLFGWKAAKHLRRAATRVIGR